MLTAAALILVFAHVQASDIASMPIFKSGMVAMIALFGIAWMATPSSPTTRTRS